MKDKVIAELISAEFRRQQNTIELIASENIVSEDILEAVGSLLTNRYAEGQIPERVLDEETGTFKIGPSRRFYNGCGIIDKIETLAVERCKELFKCDHVNVQPHSGSQANMAVYMACLQPKDTILAMDLSSGGHLTHGSPVNFSGKLYNIIPYGVDEDGYIDYDNIRELAIKYNPKLIVCGASNYSREIDFARFAEIAEEVGALLLADISHIAGLVATGLHMSPVPHADFVTTTTHKSLRGPRGAVVMCKQEWAKKIDSTIFPGIQGGPLEHVIAGKAVCFYEALQPEFYNYAQQVVKNAQVLANTLKAQGIKIVSGGTDNHLFTIDLSDSEMTGKDLANALDEIGITANKNTVPNDKRSPFITSGVRIGTPAVTTRGFITDDMIKVGCIISDVIKGTADKANLKARVRELCVKHPLPYKVDNLYVLS